MWIVTCWFSVLLVVHVYDVGECVVRCMFMRVVASDMRFSALICSAFRCS